MSYITVIDRESATAELKKILTNLPKGRQQNIMSAL